MIDTRSNRTRIIVAILLFAAAVLLLTPSTALHQQSRKYIQDVLAGLQSSPEPEQPTPVSTEPEKSTSVPAEPETTHEAAKSNFDESILYFQVDVPEFILPKFDFDDPVLHAQPHNWKGNGQKTWATFYASRSESMSDPYFVAAQQIVYRVLWDPRSRSEHAMTVFVTPLVSQEHRKYFTAAGAVVRELPLREFIPEHAGAAGRLIDMFSKLEMWSQVDFGKIAYLDSDAFPLKTVDELFDIAGDQHCNRTLLHPSPDIDAICNYTLAGRLDFNGVNAGVLVFNPNTAMYNRLIEASLNHSSFDNGFMEQALLNKVYAEDGPFPPSYFSRSYNGGYDVHAEGDPLYIVHAKLWATGFDSEDSWHKHMFNDTWTQMLDFYKSPVFREERENDGKAVLSI